MTHSTANEDSTASGRKTPRKRSWPRLPAQLPGLSRGTLVLAVLGLLALETLLVAQRQPRGIQVPSVGEVSFRHIRAVRDAAIEDAGTTERRRKEAEQAILSVYDHDVAVIGETLAVIANLFGDLRAARTALTSGPTGAPAEDGRPAGQAAASPADDRLESRYRQFVEASRLPIGFEAYKGLLAYALDPAVGQTIEAGVSDAFRRGIIGNKRLLMLESSSGVQRRILGGTGGEDHFVDLDQVLSLEEAIQAVQRLALAEFAGDRRAVELITDVAAAVLKPNLIHNLAETQQRRALAREAVKPVFFQVRQGEILVREGTRITQEIHDRLLDLQPTQRREPLGVKLFGTAVLVALAGGILVLFLRVYRPRILTDLGDLAMLAFVFVLWTATTRGMLWLAGRLAGSLSEYPYNDPGVLVLAVPYAAGAVLLALLFDAATAAISTIVFSILAGFLVGENFAVGFLTLTGSFAGIFATRRYRQRTVVLYGGLVVSLASVATLVGLDLAAGRALPMELSGRMLAGLVGGLLTGAVVTVLLPPLEHLFQVPTDMRLLELTNFDRPLLREMALRAPGTHHHALMVADLAEAAAEAVGANPLLARVGAYYHDIGKISKPDYFIENAHGRQNRHHRLTSTMSALIIGAHVKDGVELARRHKLGRAITGIIQQHHGTGLMQYFYQKAVKEAGGDPDAVSEDNYRYPGPRPQTPEAAVVMLADAVEAAARTLPSAAPRPLRELIDRIVDEKVMDRQFDECDLTFAQFRQIKESLFRNLLRFHHQRIEYPSDTASRSGRPAAAEPASPETGAEAGAEAGREGQAG